VRILLNENTIIPDTVDEVRDFFMNAGNNDVSIRPFTLGNQTLHAKVLVIDSRIDSKALAFIIGSPFEQSYFEEFFIELWNLRSREEFEGEDILPPPVPPKAAGFHLHREPVFHQPDHLRCAQAGPLHEAGYPDHYAGQ